MINFDFDTNKLKELCGKNDYRKIYRDIECELKPYFSHDQWSGYVTKEKTTKSNAYSYIVKIAKKYPNQMSCLRKLYLTEAFGRYDITLDIINETKRELKKDIAETNMSKCIKKKKIIDDYDFDK